MVNLDLMLTMTLRSFDGRDDILKRDPTFVSWKWKERSGSRSRLVVKFVKCTMTLNNMTKVKLKVAFE